MYTIDNGQGLKIAAMAYRLQKIQSVLNKIVPLLALLSSGPVFAQAFSAPVLPADAKLPNAATLLQDAPAPAPAPLPGTMEPADAELKPFGANLFEGGFSADHENGVNPNYIIQPGDRVAVRIWGATQFDQLLPVDLQGNIFIPAVGPVQLNGVRNSQLNQRVTQAVSTVYSNNVRVYTNLDGAHPVAVFVTGYVPSPGRYSGIPSQSILHFLDRAGGVDPQRGSYRSIRVMRDGETLAEADLYAFLLSGELPGIQFKDGDTIVVNALGGVVEVTGDVANPSVFELPTTRVTGQDIEATSLLLPGVTHVAVSGIRQQQPFSVYVPLQEFRGMALQHGDQVSFRIDQHDKVIVVEVEGSHMGPSRFAVPTDTRLLDLLSYIEVDPELANVDAVSLRRASIAEQQKSALQDSLRRLESKYLTASSQTDRESSIRAQEAQLIGQFVRNARQVEPDGRLVVARNDKVANVLLQSGDTITIPTRSESVLLSGEVLVSRAMLHERGRSARYYIERAGGFNQQALTDRIVVVHANGEVSAGKNPDVGPGDEIIVLPRVPVKNLQIASTIVDIVYKIAVAASVAINL